MTTRRADPEEFTPAGPAVGFRAGCRSHPGHRFPVRMAWEDARQDAISHAHTAGGHHIHVTPHAPDDPADLCGYPLHGYAHRTAVAAAHPLFGAPAARDIEKEEEP